MKPEPRIVLSLSRWDGNGVTLSACVYIGHIYGIPDHALLYLPFVQGFNLLRAPLLPPPRPVPRPCLAASLRSIHLCNPTHCFLFLFAGRPQPGHVL